jgi:hypothetical protein
MVTIRDLATEFSVPMGEVVKVVMNLGVMRTATQELPAEIVDDVRRQLKGAPPPPPPGDDGSSDGGIREPRRPNPPTLSGGAAAHEDDS